jgi:IS5 family transposase
MTQGQLGFAEAFLDPRLGVNETLVRIDGLIAWERVKPLALRVRPGETGRPPYDGLLMIKALYLQALYDLSDAGLEAALLDRLSFRRFCGLALDAPTPDATTLLRFRHAGAECGALEACFVEVNRQLEAAGLMTKTGTLMDATLIAAKHNPPPKSAGFGAPHPKEPGANWTKKAGKAHFGYKVHVGVDEGSGLIRRALTTPAKVYESEVADRLICGDEEAVYGDKAYPLKARRARLKAAGIKDRIMHRRHKSQAALSRWRQVWNKLVARRRAPVEGVFSAFKRLFGLARARCDALIHNHGDVIVCASAYNLKRAARLIAA